MALGSALAVAGGSLLGGLLGNSNSAAQASKTRDFQSEMRSTAYQTTVQDLEKAGLNPMLAYSQGPTAAPSAAMASQSDPVTPALHEGVTAYTAKKNAELIDEQKNTQVSQQLLNEALGSKAEADAQYSLASAAETRSRIPVNRAHVSSLMAGIDKIAADIKATGAQITLAKQQAVNAYLSGIKTVVDTGNARLDAKILDLVRRSSEVDVNAKETEFGRHVMPYLPAANTVSRFTK